MQERGESGSRNSTELVSFTTFRRPLRQDADGAIEIASVLLINDFLEARDAAFSAVPVEYLDLLGLLSDDDSEIEVEFAAAGRTSDFT